MGGQFERGWHSNFACAVNKTRSMSPQSRLPPLWFDEGKFESPEIWRHLLADYLAWLSHKSQSVAINPVRISKIQLIFVCQFLNLATLKHHLSPFNCNRTGNQKGEHAQIPLLQLNLFLEKRQMQVGQLKPIKLELRPVSMTIQN